MAVASLRPGPWQGVRSRRAFRQAEHVLDVGCGTGRLLRAAHDAGRSARLVGVDPSAGMVRAGSALTPAELHVARREEIPLADRSIDIAFSTIAFHHWSDPERGLREVARVLRPGGGLVLIDNLGPQWLAPYLKDRPYLTADERAALWTKAGLRVLEQRPVVDPPGVPSPAPRHGRNACRRRRVMRVTVIGAGYVGAVSAAVLAYLGNDVTCVERDRERLEAWRARADPAVRARARATSCARCDVRFSSSQTISPTPTSSSSPSGRRWAGTDRPDLEQVERPRRRSARSRPAGAVVLMRSTVPVGTCDRLQRGPLRAQMVVSNPEFLREGHASGRFLPDRIVAGGPDLRRDRSWRTIPADRSTGRPPCPGADRARRARCPSAG